MPTFTLDQVSIRSIAAAVPAYTEFNQDFSLISPKEREFLIKTTGVYSRHVVNGSLTTSDLCFVAAEKIFDSHVVQRAEIDLLIFVSQSGDYYLPATACILQQRLRLPTTTMAFDIGLGCSGYVYGLAIAAGLMKSGSMRKALLLVGDTSSITASPEDKSTRPLFGDAGTATLLELSSDTPSWLCNTYTDGSGADTIMVPDGLARNRFRDNTFTMQTVAPGIKRHQLHLALKGQDIFAFSVKEAPASIHSLMTQFDISLETLDYFVMHQANRLMNETIRKRLGIPASKTPYSLDEFGNTSSASIPLTMVTRLADALQQPQKLLLSGFGVGLSWGNIFMKTNSIDCLPLIKIA